MSIPSTKCRSEKFDAKKEALKFYKEFRISLDKYPQIKTEHSKRKGTRIAIIRKNGDRRGYFINDDLEVFEQ